MAEIKFEEALNKLENIVAELEKGDLLLDDSLARYEEGVRISVLCAKTLEAAKKRIEALVKTDDGKFALKPFNESGLEDVAIKKGKTKRAKKDGEETLL